MRRARWRCQASPGPARPAAADSASELKRSAARAGLAGIAVIAGNTIAAEPQAMIGLADAKSLFIVGLPA